jgi:hypothetical protein
VSSGAGPPPASDAGRGAPIEGAVSRIGQPSAFAGSGGRIHVAEVDRRDDESSRRTLGSRVLVEEPVAREGLRARSLELEKNEIRNGRRRNADRDRIVFVRGWTT